MFTRPLTNRRFAGLAAFVLGLASAQAYVPITDDSGIYVIVWETSTVPMRVQLPDSGTLTDGFTYTTSVEDAMTTWNSFLGATKFTFTSQAPGTYSSSDRVNEIVMDSKAQGSTFDSNTLAVTLSRTNGNSRIESDIIINTAFTWDSYRGGQLGNKQDIHRVVMHELGHVLGLDHPDAPDESGKTNQVPAQSVAAIMNSHISYSPAIDTLQTDDINGGQALYGPPGFVPANDKFANAIAITPDSNGKATVTGSNVSATHEAGEPAHHGSTGTKSVWWKWTAQSSGTVTITTLGSDFDTVLAVYTGSAVNALTEVASNDDVTDGVVRTSTVTFTTNAGTTYFIAVDGFDTYFGAITLNLTAGGTTTPASPPTITSQPGNETTTPGGSVSFTVTATGGSLSYQWKLGGNPLSGATSPTLTLNNVQAANAGSYTVTVTNSAGSVTSNAATLTVIPNSISAEVATAGHDVAFSATGDSATVQWQVSTDGGLSWNNVTDANGYSGSNTNTLQITGVTSAMNGNRYRLVSNNAGGTSTSNVATLTVVKVFFPMPVCVAADGAGNLYVGDTADDDVLKIDSAGEVSTWIGSAGTAGSTDGSGTTARVSDPSGISAASDGTLGLSDTANATIRKVTSAGVVTTLAGTAGSSGSADGTGSAARFNAPVGIAQDASGNYYVADSNNHIIRKVTSAGVVTTLAGTAGASGSLDGLGAVARFNHPTGIAVDSAGNVYVADTTNNTIRKITPAGLVSTLAGVAGVSGTSDGTGAAALFNRPTGLVVDTAGNLFLTDTGSSTIRKVTAAGAVTTIAGLPGIAGLKDGTGNDAWFNQPQDLAIDSSNTLYVADTGNASIRKVSPSGAVATMLLTPAPVVTPVSPPPTTTPPSPTPSSGGGGGGGGALGAEFSSLLFLLVCLRWSRRK